MTAGSAEPLQPEWRLQLELLNYYRAEIRFESELIAERVSALLNSQAFLVIAYTGSMSTAATRPRETVLFILPIMLTVLGLVLSILAWPGIRAAHAVIDRWTVRERELHEQFPALRLFHLEWDGEARREFARRGYQGSRFSRRAPFAFIIAWCCLGSFSIAVCLTP